MVPPVGDVVEVGRVEGVVAIVQRPLSARWTKPAKYMVAQNNLTTLDSKNKTGQTCVHHQWSLRREFP